MAQFKLNNNPLSDYFWLGTIGNYAENSCRKLSIRQFSITKGNYFHQSRSETSRSAGIDWMIRGSFCPVLVCGCAGDHPSPSLYWREGSTSIESHLIGKVAVVNYLRCAQRKKEPKRGEWTGSIVHCQRRACCSLQEKSKFRIFTTIT